VSGFEFMYRLCGAGPTIKQVLVNGTLTVHKGDFVTLAGGSIGPSATGDHNILGLCIGDGNGTTVPRVPVIVDPDAVFAVEDASARVLGACLDLDGATGAQTVTTASNDEFVVVEDKNAGEKTKVRVNVGVHHYNTAQS
jgi:hypothetical protein